MALQMKPPNGCVDTTLFSLRQSLTRFNSSHNVSFQQPFPRIICFNVNKNPKSLKHVPCLTKCLDKLSEEFSDESTSAEGKTTLRPQCPKFWKMRRNIRSHRYNRRFRRVMILRRMEKEKDATLVKKKDENVVKKDHKKVEKPKDFTPLPTDNVSPSLVGLKRGTLPLPGPKTRRLQLRKLQINSKRRQVLRAKKRKEEKVKKNKEHSVGVA